MIQEIDESKIWFLKKKNMIDTPLTRLIKKKRERTKINKIKNERGEIKTDTKEIKEIVRIYYEQLYANKLENLDTITFTSWLHRASRSTQDQRLDLSKSSFLSMCTVLGRHITLLGGAGLEHVRGSVV